MRPGSGEGRARLDREWARRLDRFERADVDPATVEQARVLGPVAWLTWAHFDADLDVTDTWPAGTRG